MDAHTLSLSAWAWRLLRDCLSAQEAEMEQGTHPGKAIATPQNFLQNLCCSLRDSGTPSFLSATTSKKYLRKYLRRHLKSQNLRKKLCKNQSTRKSLTALKSYDTNRCENSFSLEDESPWMPKSPAISNPTRQRFQIAAISVAISVAISTPSAQITIVDKDTCMIGHFLKLITVIKNTC